MTDLPTSNPGDRAAEIAAVAKTLPPSQRDSYIDRECAGDADLRRRVNVLLSEAGSPALAETLDPSTSGAASAGSLPALVEAPKMPREIGPYKLLEQIGEGGFGTVWLAEQSVPVRRRVAIKIIKPGMDSRAVVARFEQERQALAIMDHANIAKVLDAGTAPDGRPFFVMEYVAGEPITSYCDKTRLDVPARLALFIHVCEAVQHAHHKGIIHRDIKPSNVLVSIASGQPAVKIIDFGVAKALSHTLTDKTIFTEHGQILGTPEYMSPEQAEMGALDIDTRTDVYSLGVLLYELLTGALPFEARDLRSKGYNEIQRIIREVDPPKPSTKLRSLGARSDEVATRRHTKIAELEGQLRRELEWIPLKAMRKERQERYASPLAMADDIRNHLAGRPLIAGPVSAMYRARKFVSRNRLPVSAAAAVLIAVLLGGILSTIGFVQASRQRDRADAQAKLATEEAARLRQVNLYITSMLGSANPVSGEPKDVTVRELLVEAVRKLDGGALKDQPRNEAALRAVIAATYRSLSMWDEAEPQWQKAIELERATGGSESVNAATALAGLGQLQLDTGRLDDAAKSLNDALATQRRSLAGDDFRLGDTINNLGLLAELRGDFKAAQTQYREALSIYEKNPKDSPRIADASSNLAGALFRTGERAEAIRLATNALELRRKTSGEKSVDVWNSLANLATMQESTNDLAAAEKTRRDALALAAALVGEKHRMTVVSSSALGRTLWLRGGESLTEAQSVQTRALDLARSLDGDTSASAAIATDMLGCIARDRGQLDRAVELFRDALKIRRQILPAEHPDIAAAMSQLADALTRADQSPAEAVELATAALAVRQRVFGESHWATCNTRSVLGAALAANGKAAEAEPLLLQSYDGLKTGSSLGVRPQVDAANRLVVFYEKMGKMDESNRWKRLRDATPTADN
ncbi:MAG TPA: tetratricopeptide repeat protein [Tepidisphaeraceae bacterium]|nr:tetratricopeptide repeat protein [Tepidisphaeraceae bacterium]